jgi:hypothetical protein
VAIPTTSTKPMMKNPNSTGSALDIEVSCFICNKLCWFKTVRLHTG